MDSWTYDFKMVASFGFLIFILLIRFGLIRLLNKRAQELTTRALWRQVINFCCSVSALFLLIRIWFEWFQSIVTLLSVIAAAIVVVNKEILMNVFSYTIIIWRGLFQIGDRIQIGTTVGDVARLGIMYLSVVEVNSDKGDRPSGRVVKVPNKEVIDKHVINFSRGQELLWQEVTFSMPLSTNWQKAIDTLKVVLKELSHPLSKEDLDSMSDRYEDIIMDLTRDPEVFFRVDGDKYMFTCRFLCRCNNVRERLDSFWRTVLTRFEKEDDLYLVEPKS